MNMMNIIKKLKGNNIIKKLQSNKRSTFITTKKYIFVFDVESTSLHGKGIAFGAVVYSIESKKIIDSIELITKELDNECCPFVKENILPYLQEMEVVNTVEELRNKFYNFYIKYKEDSIIMSDVNYPVETNFLTSVVNDDIENRQWNMPYPLYDISNFVDVNIDRTNIYNEDLVKNVSLHGMAQYKLKQHRPLDDSKASLHCFLKYVNLKNK